MPPREALLTESSRLSTPKDYWFHRIHVILGAFVFTHLFHRYYLFFASNPPDDHDMGFNNNVRLSAQSHDHDYIAQFLNWFLPHLLLQISGFAFQLPRKRHPDGNRIWPQYRWEALMFCLRCLSISFLAWIRKVHGWKLEDGTCSIIPAAIIVFITMLSSDRVVQWHKSHYGLKGSRTIRDFGVAPRWSRYLMSSTQFHATVHCLLTSDRLSVQIAALTVVQLAAFGMTLRRKRIISPMEGVFLYSLVLGMGMLVIIDDILRRSFFHLAICLGNATAVLRMNLGMNKYFIWGGVLALLPHLMRLRDDAFPGGKYFSSISSLFLVVGCYRKS